KSAQKSRTVDDEEDEADGETKKKKIKAGAGSSNKLVIGLGLAVVGVVILGLAAVYVINSGNNRNSRGVRDGVNQDGNQEKKDENGQEKDTKKKEDLKLPDPVAAALSDAELAKLSNLLPTDTEHVFHLFAKDVFHVNSPLREAAFATPGT